MTDIAIIGGGASGMVAAIAAARLGVSVCILEKKDRVGRKVLVTGNGRCNLSNRDLDYSHYHGSAAQLLPAVWKQFDGLTVQAFWQGLGIEYTEGEKGKLYPRSLQASSVLNALRRGLEEAQVQVCTNAEAKEIRRNRLNYRIKAGQETITAKAVILCAGGRAYPSLGAAGEGARLAKSLGLYVTPMRPALCRILLEYPYLKRLAGVKVTALISLWWEGEKRQEEEGEILFTDSGVSGPPVLNLSRKAGEGLSAGQKPEIQIDLAPELEKGRLFAYLMDRLERLSGWTAEDALEGWLVKKLIPVVLAEAGVERTSPAGALGKRETGRLASVIKEWRIPVAGLAGWEEAQITVGGVASWEVTPELESRKWKGLFLAGEVLDLDGDCGGYNLQWAVSSGLMAAEKAAQYVKGSQ